MKQFIFFSAKMHPSDEDEMANSVDTDQIAPKEQSDQCLHCLIRPVCLNI